jgi:hypothetical protein
MTTIRPTWGEVFRVPPPTSADDLVRLPGSAVAVRFLLDG